MFLDTSLLSDLIVSEKHQTETGLLSINLFNDHIAASHLIVVEEITELVLGDTEGESTQLHHAVDVSLSEVLIKLNSAARLLPMQVMISGVPLTSDRSCCSRRK